MLFYADGRIYYNMLKLQVLLREYYVVKNGDTVESICRAANISPVALFKCNGFSSEKELCTGIILKLPPGGNLYTVQPGDSMETICGSKARFEQLNGTDVFYPGMKVRI